MTTLAATHDVLLLDLDGTIYLGGQVIEHVADSLRRATDLGARSMFVTNNASRSPLEVATALNDMGVQAVPDDVLTSPQAAAAMLTARHPAGSKILVVGAPFLFDTVAAAGLVPVRLAAEEPVAVVQGHSPDTGWRDLAEACIALRNGADWVACNGDATLPTDRGLLPGNGAMVAALVAATGLRPRVAGKPNRPLLDEGVRRSGGARPLVIGDRLDTDIEAGVTAGFPSVLVLSGVSTPADLIAAAPAQRPTHLAFDLRGLVEADRAVQVLSHQSDDWRIESADGSGRLARTGAGSVSEADDLQALAAMAAHSWSTGNVRWQAADEAADRALHRLGLGGNGR